MPTKCYICADQHKDTPAVAVCNELKKPVCNDHKYWCDHEGHGTSELPAARILDHLKCFLFFACMALTMYGVMSIPD